MDRSTMPDQEDDGNAVSTARVYDLRPPHTTPPSIPPISSSELRGCCQKPLDSLFSRRPCYEAQVAPFHPLLPEPDRRVCLRHRQSGSSPWTPCRFLDARRQRDEGNPDAGKKEVCCPIEAEH